MFAEAESTPATKLDSFLKQLPFPAGRLARAAGMADQYLSELRSGRVRNPQVDTIGRLRRAASTLLEREVGVEEMFVF